MLGRKRQMPKEVVEPPKSVRFRGRTYHLLPYGKSLSRDEANEKASWRRRYGHRAVVRKFGDSWYVYSFEG